jgi:hypothetical protein
MEHKRPEDTFELERADKLKVRLARNEYEGVQVFAVPDGIDLKGVKVEVSPLKLRRKGIGRFAKAVFFPTNGIKTYTVGYVKSVKSPRW